MTTGPFSVAFHIGAHKTATSHLQRSLKRASEPLAANGVRYYGPDYFRLPGRTLQALFGFRAGEANGGARRPAPEQLALLRKDGHRLLFSEENFIGPLNQPHGKAMKHRYKGAGPRLERLAAAIGQDIEVHLSIRRPTAFLNSAYCQMLLGGRVQPVAMFQRRNALSSVDWVGLIARIRAARGVGTVTVWQYEDYGRLFPQIVAGLVGNEAAPHVTPVRRHVNRGLSAAAVAQVLAQTGETPDENVGAKARHALPVEDGNPPFDGFSADEHALAEANYSRQLTEIAQMDGVTLLRLAAS